MSSGREELDPLERVLGECDTKMICVRYLVVVSHLVRKTYCR